MVHINYKITNTDLLFTSFWFERLQPTLFPPTEFVFSYTIVKGDIKLQSATHCKSNHVSPWSKSLAEEVQQSKGAVQI